MCNAYHELDEGADEVGDVGGADGVGEEAAEEGEQEGRAHEVGHRGGRLGRRVVHGLHQVSHQVARVRQERQVLKHLHNCTIFRRHTHGGAVRSFTRFRLNQSINQSRSSRIRTSTNFELALRQIDWTVSALVKAVQN